MITHEGQDSDFLPHFVGENPLPYYLAVCNHCNFIGYPEDYAPENMPEGDTSGLYVAVKKTMSRKWTQDLVVISHGHESTGGMRPCRLLPSEGH